MLEDDYQSDSDREDSDPDEDDEEHVGDPEHHHRKKIVRDAAQTVKNWIRKTVVSKDDPLTSDDVSNFFELLKDLPREVFGKVSGTRPTTVLHAIVELVVSAEDVNDKIQSKTVKLLVEELVHNYPHLLCALDKEGLNPLYIAIHAKGKKALVDQLVRSCPDDASQYLINALEHDCGNEKRKTCLHLAFESKSMKPSTLIRMLDYANSKALAAVDKTGRRPMHYAVQYARCDVDVIKKFIEKDNDALKEQKLQFHNRRVSESFLDVYGEAKRSVYQEHVASVPVTGGDKAKKDETEDKKNMKNTAPPQATQRKLDPKAGFRQEQANVRELKDAPDRGTGRREREREPERGGGHGDAIADRERLRQQLKEEEKLKREHEQREREQRERERLAPSQPPPAPIGASGAGVNAAAASAKPSAATKGGGPPLHIQTFNTQDASSERAGSDIVANTPQIRRQPTVRFDAPVEDKAERTGTRKTEGSTKKPQKSAKADPVASAAKSKIVLRLLKLHYMRTRSIEQATFWLYGTNPKSVQLSFDYRNLPTVLDEELFEVQFSALPFDEVLQYVYFNDVTVKFTETPRNEARIAAIASGRSGRQDMGFFFDFLHKKGVRYILKLTVEENGPTVHSDKSIQSALDKVVVEHLDWRKIDMDPEIICGISRQAEDITMEKKELDKGGFPNKLRQLDLRWGGNNAILRAWSEPEGLPMLKHLEGIKVIVPRGTKMYDTPEWIHDKVDAFADRLNKMLDLQRARAKEKSDQEAKVGLIHDREKKKDHIPASKPRKIAVDLVGVSKTQHKKAGTGIFAGQGIGAQGQSPKVMPQKRIITSHGWLECMDEFAAAISPFWEVTRDDFRKKVVSSGNVVVEEEGRVPARATVTAGGLDNDVVVALIDDGVDLIDPKLKDKVLEGKTFDYADDVVGQYYNSANGHGTEMAKLILRVCPMAKIYPIRLKTRMSQDGKNEIDMESAALAIEAALEKKATIISMSWTIPVPKEPDTASKRLKAALQKACSDNVLMFCSAADEGQFPDQTYPTVAERSKMFRIGAASDDGTAFSYTTKDVDFILPGVNVHVNTTTMGLDGMLSSASTGSSIATALAAGLAAVIIYCVKISVLAEKTKAHTQLMSYGNSSGPYLKEREVINIGQHEVMKKAFMTINGIGTNEEGTAKFIQVWNMFDVAMEEFKRTGASYEGKLDEIKHLSYKLLNS